MTIACKSRSAKARRILKLKARAKAQYKEADELLKALKEQVAVGKPFAIGGGRKAIVADQFSEKDDGWKAAHFNRYELEVIEA
jgi:hypothetical protein